MKQAKSLYNLVKCFSPGGEIGIDGPTLSVWDKYQLLRNKTLEAKNNLNSLNKSDFNNRTAYKEARMNAKLELNKAEGLQEAFTQDKQNKFSIRNGKLNEFNLNSQNTSLSIINSMSGVGESFLNLKNGNSLAKMGLAANVGTQALNAIDDVAMGDKNFSAQSAAIDEAVHGVSGALMKSGNPYAMAAGAALEGANFLTKAGGQTVQGFNVDINSSGYGNLGHKESSSSRDFGAMIGFGGLNAASMLRKLQRRNEEAQMALKAANISDSIKFEQEARMNSVDDVVQANQWALAGGINTSLLGS